MDTRSSSASTSAVLLRDVTHDDLASGEQIEEYLLKLSAMEQRR